MNQSFDLSTADQGIKAPPRRALATMSPDDFNLYKPAGFVLRWYALTLDLAFITPIDLLVRASIGKHLEHLTAYGHDTRALIIGFLATFVPIVIYFVLPTWHNGQTIGKRIVGLRVVATIGQPKLSFVDALMRETIGKAISFGLCGAGLLLMRTSPRLRTLHDYIGRSRVVSFDLSTRLH